MDAPYYIFRIEFRTDDITAGLHGRFGIKVLETNRDPSDLAIAAYFRKISDSSNAYQMVADVFIRVADYARMKLIRLEDNASLSPSSYGIKYYNSEELYNGVRPTTDDKGEIYKGINGTTDEYASYKLHGISAYTTVYYGSIIHGGPRIIDAKNQGTPLILRNGAGNYREGIRIYPTGNYSTIMLLGNDVNQSTYEGTSANSWGIFNNNSKFYISKNGVDGASTRLDNTDGTWRANGSQILTLSNVPKLYNHFLTITLTKLGIAYICRVNILSGNSSTITDLTNFGNVCSNAKNIFKKQTSGTRYYFSMPAEGVQSTYETSSDTLPTFVIFRLFASIDLSGSKILYIYYVDRSKNSSSYNFAIVDSTSAVSLSFSDTLTPVYGGQ